MVRRATTARSGVLSTKVETQLNFESSPRRPVVAPLLLLLLSCLIIIPSCPLLPLPPPLRCTFTLQVCWSRRWLSWLSARVALLNTAKKFFAI